MKKIVLLVFLLNTGIVLSQIQQYFFVDDINTVEHVWLKICIGSKGETLSVSNIPEKTTYKNEKVIQEIIDYRKQFDFYPETRHKNKCFDYMFQVVNKKYESLNLAKQKCQPQLKTGKFRYLDPNLKNTKIVRLSDVQIETSKDTKMAFSVEWPSPCNYVLTYLNISNEKSKYLIGQKIDVRILDVFEDGSYFYYSNLSDRTYHFGLIRKKL
ncbi:hypothetical protein [Tenacibaculum sp. 190524A05c]|uniref:GLPGLI family protein n=1 Tax=Tenacibaculum platacis TaxID=3137852 RepID=A0ABM9NVJ4_9FLAO